MGKKDFFGESQKLKNTIFVVSDLDLVSNKFFRGGYEGEEGSRRLNETLLGNLHFIVKTLIIFREKPKN